MNPILQGILVGLVVGGVLALLAYYLGGVRQNKNRKSDEVLRKEALAIEAVKERDERLAKQGERIVQLEQDVALLKAADKDATPIAAAFQAAMLAKLIHGHLPNADALLKKADEGTLTVDEAVKFAEAMKERETDPDPRIGEAEQIAARILPDIIRLNELEKENPDSGETKNVLVTVPATDTVAARDGGTQEEEKGN